MVVRRKWTRIISPGLKYRRYEGIFLLGFIPLYLEVEDLSSQDIRREERFHV